MSLDLSQIKDLLSSNRSKSLHTNKFSVDMFMWNPLSSSYTAITDYPAVAVSSPTTGIQAGLFEYQNIPIQVPIKRQNRNQLSITFYTTETLEIYSTLVSLIKVYGGEATYNSAANGNQPTVYNANNMYNQAIRDNVIWIRLLSEEDGHIVNYIGYSEAYPVDILPISFNSTDPARPGTFSVLFNFARTTTKYIGET